MITIQSKIPFDSEAAEGVKYVLRRLSKIQRAKRDLAVSKERVRFSDLMREFLTLPDGSDEKPATPEQLERRRILDYEMTLLMDAHLKPAAIRAGLVSIEGFSVEGFPGAADAVIECGGDELIDEIWGHCESLAGLSMDDQKN